MRGVLLLAAIYALIIHQSNKKKNEKRFFEEHKTKLESGKFFSGSRYYPQYNVSQSSKDMNFLFINNDLYLKWGKEE